MSKTHVYDMIIVGGGREAIRPRFTPQRGLDTLVLEKLSPGAKWL